MAGSILTLMILLLIVTHFKTDSSLGRILIYKITIGIFKDHWLNGLGIGDFSSNYLYYQAAYFKGGKFTIKELLLADDTQYAFNDYWQFILETGIKGLLLLISLITLISFYINKALKKNPDKSILLLSALFQLLAISIAALFTHIFEHFIFQLLFLVSVGVIYMYLDIKKIKYVFGIGLFSITLICWCRWGQYVSNMDSYNKLETTKGLYQSGYILDALEQYKSLYSALKNDPAFIIDYANVLLTSGYNYEAEKQYERAIKLKCSNIYYCKLAESYYISGKYKMAEDTYKMAINMVPNRFLPRYKLYQYYIETHQINLAYKTGWDALQLPVKIPSNTVMNIKRRILNNLKNLKPYHENKNANLFNTNPCCYSIYANLCLPQR